MVVLSVLSPELCPTLQIGGHIAFDVPLRMATPATFLDIAGVSLMPHFPEGLALGLRLFTRYENIQMPHSLDVVDGRYSQ